MIVTSLILSLLVSAAPTERQCLTTWAQAKAPTAAMTDGCIDWLLALGYGADWDHASLTLDPSLHGKLTIEQSRETLEAVARQLAKVCAGPTPKAQASAKRGDDSADELWRWRCERAQELLQMELGAKMGIGDTVNMEDPAGLYAKLFEGAALTWEELMPHADVEGGPCYTRVTLWKFRNAPYARHGFKFKTEDLNRFFYAPRPGGLTDYQGEPLKLLPLPTGTHEKVTLTPTDHKNVALVIRAQKQCYGE